MTEEEISGYIGAGEFTRAAEAQRLWALAEMERVAPEIAKAPARVQAFLMNVQRMLASTNYHEAEMYAREVERAAGTVAFMNIEYHRAMARLMECAPPLSIRLTRKT